MFNLKEQTIKELDELKPDALAKVYDLITELKRMNQAKKSKSTAADYIKVREALKQCKGSLSEDIILERRQDMNLFFDTSALVKFFHEEEGTDIVWGFLFTQPALIYRVDNYSSLLTTNLHCFDSVYSGEEVL